MYPDYTDVTIPKNIAPLNFLLRGDYEAVAVEADGEMLKTQDGNKMQFDLDDWHDYLKAHAGKMVKVRVYGKKDGRWLAYKSFTWTIARDTIDPVLTYRLIEPDYEVWNHLQIQERDLTSFDTKQLGDWRVQENRCMNCHAFANRDPQLSMEYVRGKGGGAILNDHGTLRKLNIKAKNATDSMVSSSVYYGFSPSGRYLTFSTNVIIPAFHARPSKRLEVYDTKSDVYVADLKTHKIFLSRLLADTTQLETFPTFSPDGRYIYYCTADRRALYGNDLRKLQYSLVRISFDERTGKIGAKVDTLVNARSGMFGGKATNKLSVCHPRISPDGRFLVFTVAYYGTFPIWHPEADLRLMDLKTGKVDDMTAANSAKSDTYHAWSSNSRWLVFASKRDDGLYGKPYFTYIDRTGKAHKPFVLPQKDPSFYDNTLKSFNVPELGSGSVPFDAVDVEKAMEQDAENFELVTLR
jgi:WD40 repeat protein